MRDHGLDRLERVFPPDDDRGVLREHLEEDRLRPSHDASPWTAATATMTKYMDGLQRSQAVVGFPEISDPPSPAGHWVARGEGLVSRRSPCWVKAMRRA